MCVADEHVWDINAGSSVLGVIIDWGTIRTFVDIQVNKGSIKHVIRHYGSCNRYTYGRWLPYDNMVSVELLRIPILAYGYIYSYIRYRVIVDLPDIVYGTTALE